MVPVQSEKYNYNPKFAIKKMVYILFSSFVSNYFKHLIRNKLFVLRAAWVNWELEEGDGGTWEYFFAICSKAYIVEQFWSNVENKDTIGESLIKL